MMRMLYDDVYVGKVAAVASAVEIVAAVAVIVVLVPLSKYTYKTCLCFSIMAGHKYMSEST